VKPIFERTRETDDHLGWVFPATGDEEPGADPDPFNGAKTIRELYEIASPNYIGKPTVPVSSLSSEPGDRIQEFPLHISYEQLD
jgi:putative glutathione S-transferase